MFSLNNQNSDTESEFSDFSSVSEGDITCKLYLAEHFSDSKSETTSFSEVSIFDDNIDENTIKEAVSNLDDSSLYLESIDLEKNG